MRPLTQVQPAQPAQVKAEKYHRLVPKLDKTASKMLISHPILKNQKFYRKLRMRSNRFCTAVTLYTFTAQKSRQLSSLNQAKIMAKLKVPPLWHFDTYLSQKIPIYK
jgi:hypothetical protein